MIVAVMNNGQDGIFTPHILQIISWLTKKIKAIENIDPDRITSLTTEKNIFGTSGGMVVEPFFKQPPKTQKQADEVRLALMDFPLYQGSLVARDNRGTLIVAELLDQNKAQEVDHALLELIAQAQIESEETIHIASEGAVSGFMGSYIDADVFVLNPIAGIVITLVCFICLRTLSGVMLPNLIVLATVASALGLMAISETPFFVITNALPVVLIGIAVADSIHILSQYYEEIATHPTESSRQITLRTMEKMWRPVTLTSLTTIAGFIGLSAASIMPPMKFFGLFATFGVVVAWLFSVAILSAFLCRLRLKPSPVFKDTKEQNNHPIGVTCLLMGLGVVVVSYPRKVLLCAMVVIILGIIGSNKILLDEAMIRTLHQQEKIYWASYRIYF